MSTLGKQKYKNCIKAIGFVAAIGVLLALIFPVWNYKDMGGGGGFQRLYQSPPDSIDAMFFGSSRAHCTINHGYLWEKYGIAGFTLSAGSQKLDSTYYCLREALRCQNPKVVFVEVSQVNNGKIENGQSDVYRNYLGMKFSQVSLSFANYLGTQMDMTREEKEELYTKFPIIHSRYRELKKEDFEDSIPFMRGYRGSFEREAFEVPLETQKTMEISSDNQEYIEKIIALTQKEEVALVLFVSPYVVSEEEQMRLNRVAQIAEQNGVPFLNFNHLYQEIGIDFSNDFRDSSHVNNAGAKKVTEYLAKYMIKYYDMENHQGDEKYLLWNQNARYLHNKDLRYQLEQAEDINAYLSQLPKKQKYLIWIQFKGNYQALGDAYLDGIMCMGLSTEDYNTGGCYFVTEGRKVTDIPDDIYVDSNQIIWIRGESYTTEIENGVNVVVYDEELEQVVDIAGDDVYAGLSMMHIDLEE